MKRVGRIATELEEEAEQTGDRATWIVASDAWSEAGAPQRAWYCFVRSAGYFDILKRRDAVKIRARMDAYNKAVEDRAQLEELADIDHDAADNLQDARAEVASKWVSFTEQGELEKFDFMAFQPKRILAFGAAPLETDSYRRNNVFTAYGDHPLGTIIERKRRPRLRLEQIVVHGINGFEYVGSAAAGDVAYPLLRRNPWLRAT